MRRWAMIAGGAAAIMAIVSALWNWGLFPATNGMIVRANAQVLQRVAGLEQFSKGTRVIALQGDRRYWQDQLDRGRMALQRDNDNGVLRQNVRSMEDTLRRINHQLRKLQE